MTIYKKLIDKIYYLQFIYINKKTNMSILYKIEADLSNKTLLTSDLCAMNNKGNTLYHLIITIHDDSIIYELHYVPPNNENNKVYEYYSFDGLYGILPLEEMHVHSPIELIDFYQKSDFRKGHRELSSVEAVDSFKETIRSILEKL